MDNFNMKQWLRENKIGPYSKASLNEMNPTTLGMGQEEADGRMLAKDSRSGGDRVDNVSMDVMAEDSSKSVVVDIKEWEVSILGKDHMIDAEVATEYSIVDDEYLDGRIIAPGGVVIEEVVAKVTSLQVEEGDEYRTVNDPAYIKQIEDLLNTDKRLREQLKDEVADSMDFDGYDDHYDDLGEAIEGGLSFDELPDCVRDNYQKNITVSVAFVKKDGTTRHIAFRRNLAAYVPSAKPKSDAQLNVLSNNNLMNVYDTNAYIKALKETNDPAAAAKMSFRNFKLDNVLAFMCKGKVFDMRERNQIKDRFGDETYGQLSQNMISALARDEQAGQAVDSELQKMSETVGYVIKTKKADPGQEF